MRKRISEEIYGALLEPLLSKYYLLSSVCGNYVDKDSEYAFFKELGSVFCVGGSKEVEAYYRESQQDHYSAICDFQSYERFCRTVEFARNSGQSMEITARDRVILAQKREAMMIQSDLFKQAKNLTKENITSILLRASNNGSIDAMSMMAFMEYHGICMPEDRRNAIKAIRRCAKWNDLFSNLMGLAYDHERTPLYADRLYTTMNTTAQRAAFEHIISSYGYTGKPKEDRIAKIVHNAFGMGIIRREVYDRGFSKVAFSSIISSEDKEKILLNKQKDAIACLSDIPFDIKNNGAIDYNEDCQSLLPIKRDGEIKRIMQNLAVAARCPREVYRPLLIISPDEFISDMYAQMLTEGIGARKIVHIDAGTLGANDLSHGREDVLLRGLCETKDSHTVFFIKNCEELDDNVLEAMCRVLEPEYRRKYRLQSPAVSLDLSSVGFVLFANEQNLAVSAISQYCDTVRAKKISPSEKETVIDSIFEQRKAAFAYYDACMDKECSEYLSSYSTDQINQIIDAALRCAVFEKKEMINLQDLRSACAEHNITAHRRGFGYTGGEAFA